MGHLRLNMAFWLEEGPIVKTGAYVNIVEKL